MYWISVNAGVCIIQTGFHIVTLVKRNHWCMCLKGIHILQVCYDIVAMEMLRVMSLKKHETCVRLYMYIYRQPCSSYISNHQRRILPHLNTIHYTGVLYCGLLGIIYLFISLRRRKPVLSPFYTMLATCSQRGGKRWLRGIATTFLPP